MRNTAAYPFLIMLLVFVSSQLAMAQGSDRVVVIVNIANPINALDKSEAKFYYLRTLRRTWTGLGTPIRPVDYATFNPIKELFLRNILRMNDTRMAAYFKQKEYAESLPMPLSFQSEEEVINYVVKHKGAIGYISLKTFNQSANTVKSVFVSE
jgi:ABC-type phosphate transport system substrate-binding protein